PSHGIHRAFTQLETLCPLLIHRRARPRAAGRRLSVPLMTVMPPPEDSTAHHGPIPLAGRRKAWVLPGGRPWCWAQWRGGGGCAGGRGGGGAEGGGGVGERPREGARRGPGGGAAAGGRADLAAEGPAELGQFPVGQELAQQRQGVGFFVGEVAGQLGAQPDQQRVQPPRAG